MVKMTSAAAFWFLLLVSAVFSDAENGSPPQVENKLVNYTVLRGEPIMLECAATGSFPIEIRWKKDNMALDADMASRYAIIDHVTDTESLKSLLLISSAEFEDTGNFSCEVTNTYGSDAMVFSVVIWTPPEAPQRVKVLDKTGRSVQLAWSAATPIPIDLYVIEYKKRKDTWGDTERVLCPGDQTLAEVYNLRPATTYNFRIFAKNKVYRSEASDVITIATSEEEPSGPPRNVQVVAVDQNTLKVSWRRLAKEDRNGRIQGYYVGYKPAAPTEFWMYETVEVVKDSTREYELMIKNLQTYTEYAVTVEAFNRVGSGPKSEEVKGYTMEGTPAFPPREVTCNTVSAGAILVKWVPPEPSGANGVVVGYTVVYGSTKRWLDETLHIERNTTTDHIMLDGLESYTNYNVKVSAFTSTGEAGVASSPVQCRTAQSVPRPIEDVKALVAGVDSILVSWKAPERAEGMITHYTVYRKTSNSDLPPQIARVPSDRMLLWFEELDSRMTYEFWVKAANRLGEAEPSPVVMASPSNEVPAKISTFETVLTANVSDNVLLVCHTVGNPLIHWMVDGIPIDVHNQQRMRLRESASLLIQNVEKSDAGLYKCFVENMYGNDTVEHTLIVNGPPDPPKISISSQTTDSIEVNLNYGSTPIQGYKLYYQAENEDWEEVDISASVTDYKLQDLSCGTLYQIYVKAYNDAGLGEDSQVLTAETVGEEPSSPDVNSFIEVSPSSATLKLSAWFDGGCQLRYFVIEYKLRGDKQWTLVSNYARPGGNFVILDLLPVTRYSLRVAAHNNAGSTVMEYDFATLTVTGDPIDTEVAVDPVVTRGSQEWMMETLSSLLEQNKEIKDDYGARINQLEAAMEEMRDGMEEIKQLLHNDDD